MFLNNCTNLNTCDVETSRFRLSDPFGENSILCRPGRYSTESSMEDLQPRFWAWRCEARGEPGPLAVRVEGPRVGTEGLIA